MMMKALTTQNSVNQMAPSLLKRNRKPSFIPLSSKVSQVSSLYNSRNFDSVGGISAAIRQEA
jgi:hypothetical protein